MAEEATSLPTEEGSGVCQEGKNALDVGKSHGKLGLSLAVLI